MSHANVSHANVSHANVSRKILNLELSDGIPDLAPVPGYGGLFVVFWWHQIPLGNCDIPAAQLPMPATQLANVALQAITPAVGCHLLEYGFRGKLPVVTHNPSRDRPPDFNGLMALEKPLSRLQEQTSPSLDVSVSVVVCTHDRPEQLATCLRSLQALSHPPHEILVVDNAPSSDATRQLISQLSGVRYILEPRPGLSVARNTGIRHSTGDIIAFTDDDVMVHPDWISRLQHGFENPEVMAVTGLMLPGELETESQLMFQGGAGGPGWKYQRLTFDAQFFKEMSSRGVPVWRIGAGANMAFRRHIFEQVGTFDERLGAGASGCSEDSEFWYRILAKGWLCYYEPTAVVFHFHRKDIQSLKQQMHHYMRGHVAALLIQFERHGHWGNLRRLFVALPQYYGKLLWHGWRKGFKHRSSTLFAEISGCLRGITFYLQNRQSSPLK